jgi:flagellar motor switch protein FliM
VRQRHAVSHYLSQSEIDAILQYVKLERGSLADDSAKAGSTVHTYDFATPLRVSREAMRAIYAIHETFLYSLVSALSARMRAAVEVELVGIDQTSYQEYILSLNNPTVLCVFGMDPLDGDAVMEFHPSLVASMVDLLFGGAGDYQSRTREITPIEQRLLSRIVTQFLDDLGRAWKDIQEMSFGLKTIERNPQFLQVLSPSEMIVLVTYEVKVEKSVGLMSIAYPLMLLEPTLESIEIQRSSSRVKPWPQQGGVDPLRRELMGVQVPVEAELGRASLSIREILELEPGDVLRLEGRVDEAISINVGGIPKLKGLPGTKRRRRAVLVTGPVEGESDGGAEQPGS